MFNICVPLPNQELADPPPDAHSDDTGTDDPVVDEPAVANSATETESVQEPDGDNVCLNPLPTVQEPNGDKACQNSQPTVHITTRSGREVRREARLIETMS